ncbi:MAG: Ig-like domain-containing protein, partial [Bacteroidetes bacterium]|nr:Ig-like domain-containing protein [Bacteroidota bacterium]
MARWDTTPPTLEISGVPAKINSATPLTATFTFDEVVTGFEPNDISITGGTKGAFTGNGSNYSLGVTPTVGSNVVVTVDANAAFDGLYNGPATETSRTATWDDSVPTLTISGVPSTINATSPFTATFTFSEDVSGFETGDIEITGASSGDLQGTGSAYTLMITPNGSTNVVLTVAVNTITDGINRGPSSPVSVTAVWSSDAPSVTIGGAPAKINSTATFTTTFTFSESVTGFESEDITLTGADKGAFAGSGQSYTLVVNPSGSADIVITVLANSATDGLNTGPTSAVTVSVVWDPTPPTLSIGGLPDQINSSATLTATFTFSEQVTGFEASSVTVSGGSKGDLTGSGSSYALAITPSGNTDVLVSVAANVATDGVNTGPTTQQSFTTQWDSSPPILTITGVPETITTTSSFTASFTFSEDVTGFENEDIEITGASSGDLQGNGSAYTLEITPTGGQNVVITISENSLSDGLNPGPTSAVSTIAIWGGLPPSIFIDDATAVEGKPMTFTVTLDQELTGGLTVTPIFTDGTATKGVDYTENTSPVNFNGIANESHTFVVETIVDELVEKDETFTVGLVLSETEQEVITSDTGLGTISDLGAPPSTSVLFIQGIHDTGIDIYLNDSRLLNDVSYRTAHLVDSVRVGMIKLDVVDSVLTSNANPLYSNQIELKKDSTYQIFLIGLNANEIHSLVLPNVVGQIPADQVRIRTIHGAGDLGQVDIDLLDNDQLTRKLGDDLMYLNVSPLLTIPPKQYTINLKENSINSIIETFSMDWSQSSNRLGSLMVSGQGQSVSEGLELFVVWANGDIAIPMLRTSVDDQPLNIHSDEIVNYPNPFVERTNLSLKLTETGDLHVEVVDILGRSVFSDILRGTQGGQTNVLIIESANWAPGIYFYQITESSGETSKVHIGKMVRVR